MVNGVTQLVMTKTDVLDSFKELEACTEYLVNGKAQNSIPFQMTRVNIEPVYKKISGWEKDISTTKSYDALPEKLKSYIGFINKEVGVPVKYISNGPDRDQIIEAK
jgi:adenylosuccinate synthase